jgi:hypothetical protein
MVVKISETSCTHEASDIHIYLRSNNAVLYYVCYWYEFIAN